MTIKLVPCHGRKKENLEMSSTNFQSNNWLLGAKEQWPFWKQSFQEIAQDSTWHLFQYIATSSYMTLTYWGVSTHCKFANRKSNCRKTFGHQIPFLYLTIRMRQDVCLTKCIHKFFILLPCCRSSYFRFKLKRPTVKVKTALCLQTKKLGH